MASTTDNATHGVAGSGPGGPGGWRRVAAGGEAYAAWTGGVRALDAEGLLRPCGPAEGPFAAHPMAALVLQINREALHHGSEVLLMRDLYRPSDLGRRFTGTPRTLPQPTRRDTAR